jgi:hypothetical protein
VSQEKSGFAVRYESPRALLRDHTSFYAQGGMIVPWRSPPPPLSTPLMIRIWAPDGTVFEISAKSAQTIPNHGFSVVFDPVSQNRSRAALDMFVKGDRFKRSVDAEKVPAGRDPTAATVTAFGFFTGSQPVLEAEMRLEPPQKPRLEENAIDADDLSLPASLNEDDTDAFEGTRDEDDTDAIPSEDDEEVLDVLPDGVEMPGPGEAYPVFALRFLNVSDFVEVGEPFKADQRLRFPYREEPVKAGQVCEVRLTLPGHNIYKMLGIVEIAGAGSVTVHFDENNTSYRKACVYLDSSQAKHRMKNEVNTERKPPTVTRLTERVPAEDPNKMPIRRRLQRMGMEDKINMALSGGKEERMALAMDGNKAIHHYLLRNAKISLDEIAFMARLPTMNPDVLEKIAENPSYTQNPSVVKALVYNPKTPTPTAIRLLDRLPRSEVMNLAKRTNMNMRLVMAAKKKIEGKRI